jgi:hypothetical protein
MDGTTAREVVVPEIHPDPNWDIGGVGNFNSDGNQDIPYRNTGTGTNSFALMNGSNLSQIVSTEILPAPNGEIGGVGDFNQDSKSVCLQAELFIVMTKI